jgi:hypothetical protein
VSEFEVDTHHAKTMELLVLKQMSSVEEYRRSFENLLYAIRPFANSLSNTMLTSQFILGLKEELRSQVEMQLPESVAKAAILAAIQEQLQEKGQKKTTRVYSQRNSGSSVKPEHKISFSTTELCKARQLREHIRSNGLCFKCGEKFSPGHKCTHANSEAGAA